MPHRPAGRDPVWELSSLERLAGSAHIQKYLQRTLLLDVTVTNVLVNSGLPASEFNLPSPTLNTGGAQ